jgi:hypothetical protein
MRNLRVHTPFVAAVVLILAGAFSLAIADQVVYFTNGKAMMVKKIEEGDGITILEIEGGGRIGVPTAQILRIEEYAVSRPNNARPPAAPQSRTAARTPPASPGGTSPQGAGAAAAGSAAVNQPANLVADAPTVVPGVNGAAAEGLAAPRDVAQRPGAAAQGAGTGAPPPSPQVAGRAGRAATAATALAAQQSMAAKMQQQRSGRLNNPRGRNNRPRGGLSGSVLMGGPPPGRPGQGAVERGTTVPANAREEEIIQAKPNNRSRGKGSASEKTPPPPKPEKDGKPEEPPSESN